MSEAHLTQPELPNFISLITRKLGNDSAISKFILSWENIIFSLIIIIIISLLAILSSRKLKLIPQSRLQNAIEIFIAGVDDFVCGILGKQGRKLVPFIGTLFIYILFMNLFGLIPLMKSPTSSWSTTLGLALCVFVYVQYIAIKQFGFLGYFDHLMGKPRGIMAFTLFIPILMFFLHIISELVRPISLSLRLRGNILGDDMLLAVLSKLGLAGVPFQIISLPLAIVASLIQAVVFSLLTTIYFALVLTHEEEKEAAHRRLNIK